MHDGNRAASRVCSEARVSSPKPSSPGIITSASTRSGGRSARCASAAAPSVAVSTSQSLQQPAQIVAHVGVVVDDQDPFADRAVPDSRRRRTRRRPRSIAASCGGSQRVRFVDERRRARAPSTRATGAAPTRSCGQMRAAGGNLHDERGAARRAGLTRVIVAAVQPHELVGQRQADARAFVRARRGRLRPGGSARTRAAAPSSGMPVPVSRTVSSTRPSRCARARSRIDPSKRELEGVGEQIEHDLLPHVAIDVDRLVERLRSRRRSAGRRARSPIERRRPARA